MRVYRIFYHEYTYRPGPGIDWVRTATKEKHLMADHSIDAVDLLRETARNRIEIASIEYVCTVDIKKPEVQG